MPTSMSGAFVELAKAGDGLERFVRVTRLVTALAARGASVADITELYDLRREVRPDARRQAEALLTFFESYRGAFEETLADAAKQGRFAPQRFADDFVGRGVAGARKLVDRYAPDVEADDDDDDDICEAIDELIVMEYTEYIAGHGAEHEVYAEQWIAIGQDEGCLES
ncbi:MAG: hypothetical protein H0X12_03395 [Nocardioides sp.]|nr:hypothetical protein [Nocardioides sp.]